jgi:hypothetical protein
VSSDYDADERDRMDERRDEGDFRPDRIVQKARSRVSTPAILLIATGALGLVLTILNLIQLSGMEAKFNEAIENIEKDPKIPANQKQQQKDLLTKVRDVWVPVALPVYALNAIVSLVIILGGIKMRSLSGRGLAILASVLAMLPIINGCCCLLGLPSGIWALIVLSNADVKAGFAAAARGSPDEY